MAHTPSKYQQAILNWLKNGSGNALVQARAGSGKTSTLVMLADNIPTNKTATFLAFNKSIATELGERLPSHVSSSTFHSLAFKSVGAALKAQNRGTWAKVEARKLDYLFDDKFGRHGQNRVSTLKLVSLMKAHAMMPTATNDELSGIMAHFDIESDIPLLETDIDVMDKARTILAANNSDTRRIDFDDMLYFVVVFDVKLPTFDYVMVDESQDTNEVQRVILRRLLKSSSRLIAVGDEAQAIYGFRGASSNSMDLIRDEFDCVTLPLSISYRCPASVIRLAQQFVPDIEARDNAPEGTVTTATTFKLSDFRQDDLIICRNTAPLITTAYKMIAARIPCKIMGRDIGKGLTTLIRKLAGTRTTLDQLPDKLSDYMDREVSAALAKRQETKAQSISDKCESILALIESMTPGDRALGINGLCAIIDNMFTDRKERLTTLATVHKSKGMEAPRVFILDRQLMPSKYARQAWQQVQEANLQYVAITRSLDTLVYLDTTTLER